MSGIPPIVPRSLRLEVGRIQDQLKVLVNNLKILHYRSSEDPLNGTLKDQLVQVKEYIFYYNQQQLAILDKIRQFLRDLETGQFVKKSQEQDELRDEQRRPKRKWSVTPSRSGTLSDEEQEDDIYLEYLSDESLYKGHVDSYEPEKESKLTLQSSLCSPVKKLKKQETDISCCEKANYMVHLDLLPENILKEYIGLFSDQQTKKKYREFLDVPEVSDKKYRNQSFLMKLAVSPPKLRERKDVSVRERARLPRPARAITFPPERMGTRKQNSIKARRRLEEDAEFEKLRKSEPDAEQ